MTSCCQRRRSMSVVCMCLRHSVNVQRSAAARWRSLWSVEAREPRRERADEEHELVAATRRRSGGGGGQRSIGIAI